MKTRNMVSLLTAAAISLFAQTAYSAEHEVKMLNAGADGIMQFEPGFLKIEKGDTVHFVATDAGHNAVSEFAPTNWEVGYSGGKVTFNEEGVNIYYCLPHKSMGMYGVIQVGNATNKADALAKTQQIEASLAMNNGRVQKYMDQVQ